MNSSQGGNTSVRFFGVFMAALTSIAAVSGVLAVCPEQQPGQSWPEVALADLKFVHDTLVEAHPAVLLPEDKLFNGWLEEGYQAAVRLANKATTRDQAFAAVKFYTVGFQDGHLAVYSDCSTEGESDWAGWTVQYRDGRPLVVHTAATWDAPLPPLGSELLGCNGEEIMQFLSREIAPFIDQRLGLRASLNYSLGHITSATNFRPTWDYQAARSCELKHQDGSRHEYPLAWRTSEEGVNQLYTRVRTKLGVSKVAANSYWVFASTFMPFDQSRGEFKEFLQRLVNARDAKTIILDARGNGGGSSYYGHLILQALYGNSAPEGHEGAKVMWRVSKIVMDELESGMHSKIVSDESTPEMVKDYMRQLEYGLRAAKQSGWQWLDPPDFADDFTDEQYPQRHRPFRGKLILITDSYCASACLDFVDGVRRVPGVVHLGEPTSVDTAYNEVAVLKTPSKLTFWIPMKAFWNLGRANKPFVPDQEFPGDINDTKALQKWVLDGPYVHSH